MLALEVIGNLGRDAEVKNHNGREFVTFSIAESTKTKDANGNQVERTTWISCTMPGNGGGLTQYLRKGTPVFARGDMRLGTYRRNDGTTEIDVNLRVRDITLLPSKRDDANTNNDDRPF